MLTAPHPVAAAGSAAAGRPRRGPLLPALLLGGAAFAVYLSNGRAISGAGNLGVSLVPVAVLTDASFETLQAAMDPEDDRLSTFRRGADGGVYPAANPVPGLLALPAAAAPVLIKDLFSRRAEQWLRFAPVVEKAGAATLAAVAAALFFLLASALGASRGHAAVLTAAFAFASCQFSAGAQGLWPQGTAVLLLLAAWLGGLKAAEGDGGGLKLSAAAGGLALAAGPASLLYLAPFWVWLAYERRVPLAPVLAAGALGLGLGLGYERYVAGGFALPALGGDPAAQLAGLLASPGRGLFLFFPLAIAGLAGFAGAHGPRRAFFRAAAAACALGLAYQALRPDWHGGHGFGPRTLTEAQPLLLLLALPVLEGARGRAWKAAFWAALAWSASVQAVGAFLYPIGGWDWKPVEVQDAPSRVWDWRDDPVRRDLAAWLERRTRPADELTDWRAAYDAPRAVKARAGARVEVPVRVTNAGGQDWLAYGDAQRKGEVMLGWHLRTRAGAELSFDAGRVPLGRTLRPGESAGLRIVFPAPAPGRYVVEPALVQEGRAWFEWRGTQPASVDLEVTE